MIVAQLTQVNAALAQRVPELEALLAEEPPGGPGSFVEEQEKEGTEPRPAATEGPQAGDERPWWRRRLFEG